MQGNGNQTKEEEKNVNHKKNSKELKSANGANGGGGICSSTSCSKRTYQVVYYMYVYVYIMFMLLNEKGLKRMVLLS